MLALAAVKLCTICIPEGKFALHAPTRVIYLLSLLMKRRKCNRLYYKFLQGVGYRGKYVGERDCSLRISQALFIISPNDMIDPRPSRCFIWHWMEPCRSVKQLAIWSPACLWCATCNKGVFLPFAAMFCHENLVINNLGWDIVRNINL